MTIHIGWLLEWVIPMVLVALPGVFFGGLFGALSNVAFKSAANEDAWSANGMVIGVAIVEVTFLTLKGVIVWVL